MKFLRFQADEKIRFGILAGEEIQEISGSYLEEWSLTGARFDSKSVKLLPPCTPSKVVAVGLNYLDHIKEFGRRETPQSPVLFVKLPHTIIGQGDAIIRPEGATRVDFEAELAVVIKEDCKNVTPEEAKNFIFGVTCLNDVTERDIQKLDGQWMRAKNFETFCPIGPYVADGLDYNHLGIESYLNGTKMQSSNTEHFIWKVEELVSFISKVFPLSKGDMITTGTPSGVGPMVSGDVIEIVIEGIGTLTNNVR